MGNVTIVEDTFGVTNQPITGAEETVKRFTFSNDNGLSVQVITLGATVTTISAPDKHGNIEDVVLGFDDVKGIQSDRNPYFGTTVGRVCNRINSGRFVINGKTYQVDKNWKNKHHLHGGNIGFNKFNWAAYREGNKILMTHVNPDNLGGYPGAVIAIVSFELTGDNDFNVLFTATSSAPTPINLTNHSYFNLAGHDKGHKEIYDHVITLNADKLTETDMDSIPTGKYVSLSDTGYDLRIAQPIGPSIARIAANGYDDNYCVTRGQEQTGLAFVAHVIHPKSGRILEVYSDQPGVQLYTSNFMPDPNNSIYPEGKAKDPNATSDAEPIFGKNGATYFKHGAFCLETQNFPDAVNHENFPNSILKPGERYSHSVQYKFLVAP